MMTISGSLDVFHLAYVPAAPLPTEAAAESKDEDECCLRSDDVRVRKSSSIHLYRCRNIHGINAAHDRNIVASFDGCNCCCCHVERCLQNSTSHYDAGAGSSSLSYLSWGNLFLAILVPPSFTEQYTRKELDNFDNFLESENRENENNQSGVSPQKKGWGTEASTNFDTIEKDLFESIHPSLFLNQSPKTNRSNGNRTTNNMHADPNINDTHNEDTTTPEISNFQVCGIITCDTSLQRRSFPADIVLLQIRPDKINSSITSLYDHLSVISHHLNHDTSSNAPWAILKAFIVSSVSIIQTPTETSSIHDNYTPRNPFRKNASLPCCPVCLNRIEPKHLGLPDLNMQQKCSQWCADASLACKNESPSCVNEMQLLPWPSPSHCVACHIICERELCLDSHVSVTESNNQHHDNSLGASFDGSSSSLLPSPASKQRAHLTCHRCGITNTLWVCLTCGVVGCGRYTLKHAEEHFTLTGHPYSLELATMRIWDYENGRFAHRRDLVECPVLSAKWGGLLPLVEHARGLNQGLATSLSAAERFRQDESVSYSGDDVNESKWTKLNRSNCQTGDTSMQQRTSSQLMGESASCHSVASSTASASAEKQTSPPPKKGMMISQEYEALLQSALEDQSQHFEGEISRLRAELATSRMQHMQHISDRESREIEALRVDSERLRREADQLTSALLEVQTEEAKHRAVSQKLLREQSIAKDLLEKLRKETHQVHESRSQQMEDLELQIADLTANLRMRMQIAKDEELSQAQIFGTTGGADSGGKKNRGKKSRRFLRR